MPISHPVISYREFLIDVNSLDVLDTATEILNIHKADVTEPEVLEVLEVNIT